MDTDNPITTVRLVFIRAGKQRRGTASPGRTPDLQSSDNPQPSARTKKISFSIFNCQGAREFDPLWNNKKTCLRNIRGRWEVPDVKVSAKPLNEGESVSRWFPAGEWFLMVAVARWRTRMAQSNRVEALARRCNGKMSGL